MEWAAGETWKGIEWCYNTAPCKAAAIKYGTMAVEDAMKAASLQELHRHHHHHSIGHSLFKQVAKPMEHATVKAATTAMVSAADLQQLNWFSGAVHSVEHDVSTAAHDIEPSAKYAAGKAW